MINNFEDEDILYYMGSELGDGKVSYIRNVVKKFFDEGGWEIYDESLNESNDWGGLKMFLELRNLVKNIDTLKL